MSAEYLEPATSAVALSTQKQTLIPSADRTLALTAISTQINQVKAAWKEKYGNSGNPLKEAFFMNSIDKVATAISTQLELVTAPSDIEVIEQKLEAFQNRQFTARPSSPSSFIDDESLSSSDDDDEEIDFDEREIIDQEATQKVQQLRLQARDIATRVISLREETLERVLEGTNRRIVELLRVHGYSEDLNEEELSSGNATINEENSNYNLHSKQMHSALHSLTQLLNNVDYCFNDKLESLRETIGTIDSSIDKYERFSQGDEKALSQTEKVLLSTSHGLRNKINKISEEEYQVDDTIADPNKELAHLLASFS